MAVVRQFCTPVTCLKFSIYIDNYTPKMYTLNIVKLKNTLQKRINSKTCEYMR